MSEAEPRFVPVLRPHQQFVLLALVLVWAVAIGLFWAWWLQPATGQAPGVWRSIPCCSWW